MHPQDGRVVSNFIVHALTGRPITIYGDGSQTKSFCYVDDMVEACLSLMGSAQGLTGPINLDDPDELTIKELAELVAELTGSRSGFTYMPLPYDDPVRRRPDITLAKRHIIGGPP